MDEQPTLWVSEFELARALKHGIPSYTVEDTVKLCRRKLRQYGLVDTSVNVEAEDKRLVLLPDSRIEQMVSELALRLWQARDVTSQILYHIGDGVATIAQSNLASAFEINWFGTYRKRDSHWNLKILEEGIQSNEPGDEGHFLTKATNELRMYRMDW